MSKIEENLRFAVLLYETVTVLTLAICAFELL